MSDVQPTAYRSRGYGTSVVTLLAIANVVVFIWAGWQLFRFSTVNVSLHQLSGSDFAPPGSIEFRREQPRPSVKVSPSALDWLPTDVVELPEVERQLTEVGEINAEDWNQLASRISDRSLPVHLRTQWLRTSIKLPPPEGDDRSPLTQQFNKLVQENRDLPPTILAGLGLHWSESIEPPDDHQSFQLRQAANRLDRNRRLAPPTRRRGIEIDTTTSSVDRAAVPSIPRAIRGQSGITTSRSQSRLSPRGLSGITTSRPQSRLSPKMIAGRWLSVLKQPEGFGRYVPDIQTAGPDDPAVAELIQAAMVELEGFNKTEQRSLKTLPAWVDRVAIACRNPNLFALLRQTVSESGPIEGAGPVDRWIGVALADGDSRWATVLLEALPRGTIPPRWKNHEAALQTDPWLADLAGAVSILSNEDASILVERLTDENAAGRVVRQMVIDRPSWPPELIEAVASGIKDTSSQRSDRWQWVGHTWPDRKTRQQLAKLIPDDLDWPMWFAIAPVLPPEHVSKSRWVDAAERGVLPMLLMPALIDSNPIDWAAISERLEGLPPGPVFPEGGQRLDWAVTLRILRFVAEDESLPTDFVDVAARCGSDRTVAVLGRLEALPGSSLPPDAAKQLAERIRSRDSQPKSNP